ncbi:MAG: dihydrodipicolinate synthase family protein [Bryobacterales bacterium]|nr:dihydrodipicolinate synthase family protein [Bryobacterales bacterium]
MKMRYHQTILISCEVPWDENEQFLSDLFRAQVAHATASGFHDVYVFGTAGEGYAVTNKQFTEIVEVFAEETLRDGIHPQVGVIGLSSGQVIERIEIAHRLGFRAFQISLPSWGMLNDSEMLRFFEHVCGSFPDSKFLHYNLMRTKRLLTATDYRRVADRVPNLAATKNTGLTIPATAELMRTVPEIQHFFGETLLPIGTLYGECSLLSSFGPMMPRKTHELFSYARKRQFDKLFTFQRDYMVVVEDVIAPMRKESLIDGAYDKLLVRLGGVDIPLRLLSPYQGFDESVYEECRRTLHEKYADWLG